ncbi:MAG TPA: glycosyltransferase [Chloroflexota bacterium]|nr:glycosyltransferase [Chloroflexota bacterium]
MSGERGPSVSVVVPCYNEETNLRAGCLTHVATYAERADDILEVLVVDDGSVDASRDLVRALARRYPKVRLLAEPHRGKAGAVIAGIRGAAGAYVLFTDMDQATPIEEIEKFRPKLAAGDDVVVGSRHGRRGAPPVRKLMAAGFMVVRRLIVDVGRVSDTQCGFKALRAPMARAICDQLRVFRPGVRQAGGATVTAGFDAELLFVARRFGARIAEVPVTWHYVGTRRVHPIRESWRGIKGLLQIRLAALRGDYDRPPAAPSPPVRGPAPVAAESPPEPTRAARADETRTAP